MNEVNGYYQIAVHPSRINYFYTPINRSHSHTTKFTSNEEVIDFLERQSPPDNPVAPNQPEQFRDNYHHGKISKTAERKINRAIDYITYLAKPKRLPHTKHGKGLLFRLNFVTLTLSSKQTHSDHEIYERIFRPFLMALHRVWKVNNYIWRAERQSNGRLHYHIITDRFIPWNELRNVWNRCQQHLDYVSEYRKERELWHRNGFKYDPDDGKKRSKIQQLKAYQEGIRHDWNSPNSTDVHSLRFVYRIKAYFKKYMTKEGQNSDIEGRLWGCSERLSDLTGARAADYSRIDEELRKIQADKSFKIFSTEYFTTIFITPADLERLHCTHILNLFLEYIRTKFPDYMPPSLFD